MDLGLDGSDYYKVKDALFSKSVYPPQVVSENSSFFIKKTIFKNQSGTRSELQHMVFMKSCDPKAWQPIYLEANIPG